MDSIMNVLARTIMLLACVLWTAFANAQVIQVSSGYEVSYSIYLPVGAVPAGQNIHHVFIFEWNESQQNADYVFEIAGSGRTVLSHVIPFEPTSAFVIGFIDPVPGAIEGSNDAKRHLYTLVDSGFSDSLVENDLGKLFSERFGQGEQFTINLMIDASEGSEEALDQLWEFVTNSPMAEAAFDPADGFRIHKWSIITPPIDPFFEDGFEGP
jgi:hypothetical protein